MKNIAIFASGEGTNAQKIIDHFRQSARGRVSLVVCNKPGAGVLRRAEQANVPVLMINRSSFYESDEVIRHLHSNNIDLIVLAGFLWMIPADLIQAFPEKIINIHPALLPKFGGKGMYGMNVHKAVIDSAEKQSGITIHFVNENYDEGKIIAQHTCYITSLDTFETLAEKIHELEHRYYPQTIEKALEIIR
ncbi:MAG: phosphoribosylglycinamide formyltransferase [Bacteroidota bacterium]|nr:phosphoribosylglycinamide formyltransferase [Bacteroidota bacterium]